MQGGQGNSGFNSGSYANQNPPPLNITTIGSNNTTITDNGNIGGFIQGGGSGEAKGNGPPPANKPGDILD